MPRTLHYDCFSKFFLIVRRRFGAIAVGFNLIPVVGLLFNVTSTVGAALWANKMEKRQDTAAASGRKVDRVGESAEDMKIQDQVRVQL
jgi:hypothetical protein